MSPTVFRIKSYRFFFFSREEERRHVHVESPNGEAKFWLDPVRLAEHQGFTKTQLRELRKIVETRKDEIAKAWERHFKG